MNEKEPQQLSEIYCPKCGALNSSDNKFCFRCGTDLPSGNRNGMENLLRNDNPSPQVINSIECTDNMNEILFIHYPPRGLMYMKMGSQILLHNKQCAVLSSNGKLFDVFGFGHHTISVESAPKLAQYLNEKFIADVPFPLEIYFVSTREHILPWGTPQAILAGNHKSNITLLQMFGTICVEVVSPVKLIDKIGSFGTFRSSELHKYYLGATIATLRKIIAEFSNQMSALEIIGNVDEISRKVKSKSKRLFKEFGISLKSFHIESINPADFSKGVLQSGLVFEIQNSQKKDDISNKFYIEKGELTMGDTYIAGQAGAIGPNSHAHDMTFFNLIWEQSKSNIDLNQLAQELNELRLNLKEKSGTVEQDATVGEIASAEMAAKSSDGPTLMKHLSRAGKWAFDVATEIGVVLAAETIKKSLGL